MRESAMSKTNVRRFCGAAIGLGILLAFSTTASATRGRVKVANNTIVTDRGTLIRGARVSLDIWDETPSQADIDTMKNSRGLNAFHIYAEYPGGGKSGGYNAAKVDKVVDLADTNDLYVVLTIGSGGGNGSFNQSFVTSFWNFYAPRYKDRTHVVYEVCNEPQAWSAPYNSATLAMEKNAYTQIRGLAPDTHIMMMSYSQPNNWTQAAAECANLGVTWDNASVAFHTYGIDGKEDSTLTSFYTAMKAKGIAYACTEPNLTLKAITTKLFERDGVSETQFINVHDIATNASAFSSWITSNKICWTPDFGTWPSCAGTVAGTGGSTGGSTGGTTGAAGTRGTGSGGVGGAGAARGGNGGGRAGSSGTGGAMAETGGAPGSGGSVVAGTGGTAPGSGGATSPGTGGTPSNGSGGSPAVGTGGSGTAPGDSGSSGCTCEASAGSTGGNAAAFGLLALALVGLRARRRAVRHPRQP
jgi:MYXO-CTERM domain-containing protein